MLAIRITRPYSALIPFFDKLKTFSDKLIVYEHTESARPHIHGLIVNCRPSTDTLKNWIRQVVGKVEKTDWSFVTKQVDETFITYMSKGHLNPVFTYNYEFEVIDEYKSKWEDRPKIKKQTRLTFVVRESPAERKLRQEEMIEEITIRYNQLPVSERDDEQLIKLIYRVVAVENKNMLSRFKVRDYYDAVLARVHPESWLKAMKNIVAYKS